MAAKYRVRLLGSTRQGCIISGVTLQGCFRNGARRHDWNGYGAGIQGCFRYGARLHDWNGYGAGIQGCFRYGPRLHVWNGYFQFNSIYKCLLSDRYQNTTQLVQSHIIRLSQTFNKYLSSTMKSLILRHVAARRHSETSLRRKLKCIIIENTDVPPDQSSLILLPPKNAWPSMFISDNKTLFCVVRDKGGEKLP